MPEKNDTLFKEYCPHLGLQEDRQQRLDYPGYQHRCYAGGEQQPVSNMEQVRHCMSGQFRSCPRFLAARRYASPPAERPARAVPFRSLLFGALALLVFVCIAGLLFYTAPAWMTGVVSASGVIGNGGQLLAADTPTCTCTPLPALSATPLPPTPSPTVTFTPSPSPTPTPTFTPSPSPTPTRIAANAPPDRIVAPAIDLDSPVSPIGWHLEEQDGEEVSVWEVTDYVAGWHRNSAYPGRGSNVVLSGHHNIKGEVFRYLVDLKPGDLVTLYVGELSFDYAVEKLLILKDKEASLAERRQNGRWIKPTPYEQLTLVTCWPYTNNTHRLIVVAKPVPAQ
jgi:LPXTG-site transpeptidase (sortase) family protein